MKETVYLAGKITGDPFYRMKFYDAGAQVGGTRLRGCQSGDVAFGGVQL